MTFTHGILYCFVQDSRKSGMCDMRILNYKIYTKKKVNQSRYRPGVAQRVPGS